MSNQPYKTIQTKTGNTLAYCQTLGNPQTPGIMFLGGFMSDMQGTKATFLESVCRKLEVSYIRFDYFGHGASSGNFKDATISQWKQDALFVLDELTQGPQILIGSSMGGWIMVLLALERLSRIKGLIGIAAAPDFIKDFSRLTQEQRETLERDGIFYLPSRYGEPYPITRQLLEDGFKHCVLENPLPIECPVRLLHGLNDEQVPWQHSVNFANYLTSKDIIITLIKDGDHRLSETSQLALLDETLQSLLSCA